MPAAQGDAMDVEAFKLLTWPVQAAVLGGWFAGLCGLYVLAYVAIRSFVAGWMGG